MRHITKGIVLIALGIGAGKAWAAPATQQVQTIPLDGVEGRFDHMAIDSTRQRVYVAALGNNTVEIVDLKEGKRVGRIDGLKKPQGVCVLDEGRVAIASGGDGKLRVYDAQQKLLGTVADLDDADNVRYDDAAKRIYVGYGEGALAVIDAQKLAKINQIKLDGHPESFQLESRGPRIYVNVPDARQVAVVDREKCAVVATWAMRDAQANFPMALDEANHRLLVATRKPARLIVLDTESGKTVASVECCADADDVFWEPAAKRAYISGGEGCVSVFARGDKDDYRLVERIATAPGARTSIFETTGNRLIVAVPHRTKQQAQLQVYRFAQ